MNKNYEDSKCAWGYMTLCENCITKAPEHVNTSVEVLGFPTPHCELCEPYKTGADFQPKRKGN